MSARTAAALIGIGIGIAMTARAEIAAAAGCNGTGTSLYFGNGVNTTYDEAWEDADDDLPGLAAEGGVNDVVAVGVAYNHTDGLMADIIQTLEQKEAEDPRFGWYLLNNVSGYLLRGLTVIGVLDLPADATALVAALQAIINQGLADSLGHPGTFYDADVADQVSAYEEDLSVNGHRVLVVAHSQGTLYANAARAALAGVDSANLGSFGIVAVGDAAEVSFNGYVTSDNDLVINALRTLGRTVLPANIDVPVNAGDFTGHLFEATYLDAQLPARQSVVALLSAVAQGAPYPARPETSCTGGSSSTAAIAVSVSTQSACALTAGGAVKCWGHNGLGLLGDGTNNNATVPVQVVGLESGVKSISVGDGTGISIPSACAVTADGAVKCWGLNGLGKLGSGLTATSSTVPVQVSGLESGVASVSVGAVSSCALMSGGGVMCWGDNADGILGNGSQVNSAVPVSVAGLDSVTKVSVGNRAACAIRVGGDLWCWGGGMGGLYIGTSLVGVNAFVPVQVTGLTGTSTDVAVGSNDACAIVTGGAVMCWGSNLFGQLGTVLPPPSVTGSLVPVSVSGLGDAATAIAVGDYAACAVLADGSVKCWGDGGAGRLGNGSTGNSFTPVQVTGLSSGFKSVSTSLLGCAVGVAGDVKCWGNINQGFLGNGETAGSLVPVPVTGFP